MTRQLDKWATMLGFQPRLVVKIEDGRRQRGGLAPQARGTLTVQVETATGRVTTAVANQDFGWAFESEELPAQIQRDLDGFKAAMDQQFGADQWIYSEERR